MNQPKSRTLEVIGTHSLSLTLFCSNAFLKKCCLQQNPLYVYLLRSKFHCVQQGLITREITTAHWCSIVLKLRWDWFHDTQCWCSTSVPFLNEVSPEMKGLVGTVWYRGTLCCSRLGKEGYTILVTTVCETLLASFEIPWLLSLFLSVAFSGDSIHSRSANFGGHLRHQIGRAAHHCCGSSHSLDWKKIRGKEQKRSGLECLWKRGHGAKEDICSSPLAVPSLWHALLGWEPRFDGKYLSASHQGRANA